jgi:hypothetical protein
MADPVSSLSAILHRPRTMAPVASVFLTHVTSNIAAQVWNTKYRLIIYMSVQIESNLRDESIKPN